MLPAKVDLTEELATFLRQLRLDHPVNGEVLTAEKLSKAIGNNRAWMSQIESRRLKKIKREDIIKIYSYLYLYDENKSEKIAELDIISVNETNKDMDDILLENIQLKRENEMLKKKLQSIMEIIKE